MNRTLGASFLVGALAVAGTATIPNAPAAASPIVRPADPVVLTGSQLPTLVNGVRTTIVGFRWNGAAWQQLPIQVDERAVVNFGKIYNNPSAIFYSSQPGLTSQLVYTSGATWTGADPDHKFDANDELVFMARDAGVQAPGGSQPLGTAVNTGVAVHVTDPVNAGSEGWVYLFRKSAGSPLKQAAGVRYMKYTFKLLSGGYKTTYQLSNITSNAENSLVTGATYKRHFSNRWLTDQLNVTAPGATNVDILDRNKVQFAPNVCQRSEDTFDVSSAFGTAEGAFVVNTNGPVRSIRSYLGANSGPNTQRTHIFYDRREDVRTDLRVHPIASIMDFRDYSAAAVGMVYRNSSNQAGVTIDGVNDTLAAGAPTWEQVAGAQGSVTMVHSVQGSFATTIASHYADQATPTLVQCTGDATSYGASGTYITSALPCTDPAQGCSDTLQSTTTSYYEAPGANAATALQHAAEVAQPLVAATAAWVP